MKELKAIGGQIKVKPIAYPITKGNAFYFNEDSAKERGKTP